MKVSNPLTIIAIFAGLAETLATVALVKLPPEIQSIFVYFVMVFPAGIVLLFFFVLFFKNTVLYAPSDFENQSHYLEANKIKENISEQLDKIFSELNKSGTRLTKAEIDNAKNKVINSVEVSTTLSTREVIICESIMNGYTTPHDISEKIDFPIRKVKLYLHTLKAKGFVRYENGEWYVNV